MDRNEKLTEVATTLGLRDLDLLKVARADLPPAEAVMDLLKRFRGAFDAESFSLLEQAPQPKSFKEMSLVEQDEFRRKHKIPGQVKMVREPDIYERMSPADKAAFHRKNHLPESIGKTRPVGLKTRFR